MLYVANDLSISTEGASAHLLANAFWDRLLASVIFYDIYLYRKRICKNSLGICQYPYVFTLAIQCLVVQDTSSFAKMVDHKRKMVFFNGTIKLKICEAVDLRPTDFATRHQVGSQKNVQVIDPYISVDVDDVPVARTTTKQKSVKPTWNEDFTTEVHNGQTIGLTVFHDAAIPPDEFVANCTIAFDDLSGKLSSDIWVRSCLVFARGFGPVGPMKWGEVCALRARCFSVGWTPFR